ADRGAAGARRAPALGMVAVLIDANAGREHTTVLPPEVVDGEHVAIPVRVPDRRDPDRMVVDRRRDPWIAAVSADQPLGCVERDDGRDDLPSVMGAPDQHGPLVLVLRHVVGVLQGGEVAAVEGWWGAVGGRD